MMFGKQILGKKISCANSLFFRVHSASMQRTNAVIETSNAKLPPGSHSVNTLSATSTGLVYQKLKTHLPSNFSEK